MMLRATPTHCAIALTMALTAAPLQAAFVADYSGWVEMNDCPVCDTTVSFAVWENSDGNWSDDFPGQAVRLDAMGNPDYTAPYVYLYQIVNTDYNNTPVLGITEDEPIRDFQVINRGNHFSSGGYLPAVFQDGVGPLQGVASGNITLADSDFAEDSYDKDMDFSTPEDDPAPDMVPDPVRNLTPSSDHRPNVSGVTGFDVVADSGYVAPSTLDLFVEENFGFNPMDPMSMLWVPVVDFNWDYPGVAVDGFVSGAYSPVLFLTSARAPVFDIGSTRSVNSSNPPVFPPIPDRDGNYESVFPGANGDLPTAMSLPASWILLAVGLAGMSYRR